MKVVLIFFGSLTGRPTEEKVVYTLPEGATYGLLLEELGKQAGRLFHERIWDADGRTFKPGIRVLGEGREFHRKDTLLRDGEKIHILPLLGGG